jgi:hypothetical protein
LKKISSLFVGRCYGLPLKKRHGAGSEILTSRPFENHLEKKQAIQVKGTTKQADTQPANKEDVRRNCTCKRKQ